MLTTLCRASTAETVVPFTSRTLSVHSINKDAWFITIFSEAIFVHPAPRESICVQDNGPEPCTALHSGANSTYQPFFLWTSSGYQPTPGMPMSIVWSRTSYCHLWWHNDWLQKGLLSDPSSAWGTESITGNKHSEYVLVSNTRACSLFLKYAGISKDRKQIFCPKQLSEAEFRELCASWQEGTSLSLQHL